MNDRGLDTAVSPGYGRPPLERESLGARLKEWLAFHVQRFRIRRQFQASVGSPGNFENPRTYPEKVQFRKLYGNHRFYASVTDKYEVRRYVAARVPSVHLIPLLGVYARLQARDFDTLPQRFIIKANHGCKWNQVVTDKTELDVGRAVRWFNTLIRKRYGWIAGERHYNFIKPKIVIEELLQDRHGGLPWDYSFFCYNSSAGFDYNIAICAPDGRNACFTREWEILTSKLTADELDSRTRPPNFDVMVDVARRLSSDFDFVRVDLYNVDGRVYFGEMTCTPHQGYGVIADERQRRLRDDMWILDAHNPLLYRAP